MPWVKGVVCGEVTADRRIVAQTRNLQVMTTPKPPDPDAARAAGLDVDLLRRIHEERKPGRFEGLAHFGGATAMLVPWSALALHQSAFDDEQRSIWSIVRPDLRQVQEEPLELLSVGLDHLDDQSGIVTAGPAGDVELTRL